MADPSSILQSPLVPIYLVDDGTNQGVPCRVSTRPREQSVSSYRKQPMATIGGILRVGSLTVGLTTAKIEREDSIQLDRPGRSGHGAVGYLQVQRKGYDWALVILQHGLGTPVRVPDETGRIEETGPIINNIAEPHRISKIAQGKETVEIITSFGGLKPLIRGKGSEYNSVATPSELASQSSSTELESSLTVIADISEYHEFPSSTLLIIERAE
ncbi:hypothetical protein F5B22DRAFT_622872 [Xylaria bambusicola]|uniref:uncharacterized protein n=1 Tax=Xylaria bambusicola TaxID=326684 RepID=UPI002007D2B3|nr:uncharacterized protein F5B22DRAFT_622872 [Xylaria bambusicola]KAI0506690.1 hypothetical protein F5B22DRAFT_622872 [Xylaria bambusicola]